MKTVFSNSMCAHVWAQQTQPHGHSGSMRFDGPTIYSYATAMAKIHAEQNIVLINERTYSITTSGKHMPAIHSAIRGRADIRVPTIDPRCAADHKANLKSLERRYNETVATLKRARNINGDWQYERLRERFADLNVYAVAFKRKRPAFDVQREIDEIKAFCVAREARLNTPANIAKREKARVKRAAAAEVKNAAYLAEREAQEQARVKYRAELAAEQLTYIPRWRLGENLNLSYLEYALLRYNSAENRVETSQGAEVPASDAVRAVRFITKVRARGTLWQANGEQLPVGQFHINSIGPQGNIKAGCHKIEWAEIESLGVTLAAHGVE